MARLRSLVGSVVLAVFSRLRPHRWLPPALSLRLLRPFFEAGSRDLARAMRATLPPAADVRVTTDLVYDPATGRDGLFDLVLPAPDPDPGGARPPLIVWTHGGGWYYGSKADPLPYLELLARHGYAGASLNGPRTPEHRHPAGPRAAAGALSHLVAHAEEYGFDPTRIVLAGDSAGAQLAGAVALACVSPDYAAALGVTAPLPAASLRGLVLFSGTVDLPALLRAGRMFTAVLASAAWAVSGTRRWPDSETADLMTLRRHVTTDLPPIFVRAGRADPLTAGGSVPLVARLREIGVAPDHAVLGDAADGGAHNLQFLLGTPHADAILADLLAFLRRTTSSHSH